MSNEGNAKSIATVPQRVHAVVDVYCLDTLISTSEELQAIFLRRSRDERVSSYCIEVIDVTCLSEEAGYFVKVKKNEQMDKYLAENQDPKTEETLRPAINIEDDEQFQLEPLKETVDDATCIFSTNTAIASNAPTTLATSLTSVVQKSDKPYT